MNLKKRLKTTPKITLVELAAASGVSKSAINDIETGTTKNPGHQTVRKINNALRRLIHHRENTVAQS